MNPSRGYKIAAESGMTRRTWSLWTRLVLSLPSGVSSCLLLGQKEGRDVPSFLGQCRMIVGRGLFLVWCLSTDSPDQA